MKSLFFSSLIVLITLASCKKENKSTNNSAQDKPRTVRFTLYTDQDLSADDQQILFTVFIQTGSNQPVWDSTLTPMRVKDIPALANKIVVNKTITGYANSLLKVGFRYTVDGVGDSWHYDAGSPGDSLTEVIFNFQ